MLALNHIAGFDLAGDAMPYKNCPKMRNLKKSGIRQNGVKHAVLR